MFSRFLTAKATKRRMLAVGVLGATVALTASMTAGAASATVTPHLPKGSTIPLGDGYMGVGYTQDSKDFKPDSRHLVLSPSTVSGDGGVRRWPVVGARGGVGVP